MNSPPTPPDRRGPAWLPPRAALRAAVALAVPIVGVAALAYAALGGAAAAGAVLGVVGGLGVVVLDLPWSLRLVLGAAVPAVGWLGVTVAGEPWAAAVAVGAVALLQWPAGPRVGGGLAMLPLVTALGASVGITDATGFALGAAAGVSLLAILAALMHLSAPVVPVPAGTARRHALVSAVATGAATALAMESGVTHGYWMVLALALILRPVPDETTREAVDRTLGTLSGTVLAILAVLFLPGWLVGVFVIGCLLVGLAWAVGRDVRRQTLFTTPVVVLTGSAGVAGTSVGLAAERLVLFTAAAMVAVALALLLRRWDEWASRSVTDAG